MIFKDRGILTKRWMNGVKDEIHMQEMNNQMTDDKDEWMNLSAVGAQ